MSVWNQSVILGFPILAVAALRQGARNRMLEIAAPAGLAVFAVIVAGSATISPRASGLHTGSATAPHVLSARLGASSTRPRSNERRVLRPLPR